MSLHLIVAAVSCLPMLSIVERQGIAMQRQAIMHVAVLFKKQTLLGGRAVVIYRL